MKTQRVLEILLARLCHLGVWSAMLLSVGMLRAGDPYCDPVVIGMLGGGIEVHLSACNPVAYLELTLYSAPSITKDSIVWQKDCSGEACDAVELIPIVLSDGLAWGCEVKYSGTSKQDGTVKVKATLNYYLDNCPGDTGPKSVSDETELSVDGEGEDCGTCGGAGGGGGAGGQPGNGGPPGRSGGLETILQMGSMPDHRTAGFLSISSALPSISVTDPSGLVYGFRQTGVFVYPASGTLQQVKSPQALARVVDPTANDGQYSIEYFYSADVSFNGTLYVPNGGAAPFVTWTIRNPSGYGQTDVVEVSNSNGDTWTFVYNASDSTWTLTEPGNLRTIVTWEKTVGGVLERGQEVRRGSTVISKTVRQYQIMSAVPYLWQVIEGSGSTVLTTTYTLITTGDNAGRPSRIDYPDGRWEMFEYGDYGRVSVHYAAYGVMAPPAGQDTPAAGTCRRTTFDYALLSGAEPYAYRPSRPRVTQVDVPSYDSGSQSWSWVTVSTRFYWTPDSATEVEAVSIRPGTANCSWSDSDNLVTTRVAYDDPTEPTTYAKTKLTIRPDGTGSLFTYPADPVYLITVEKTGQLDVNQTAILNGKEITTSENSWGRVVSVVEKLIDENVAGGDPSTVLAQTTYAYSTTAPYKDYTVTDLAGRTTQFAFKVCCNLLDKVTRPDGDMTAYGYDALYRLVVTTNSFGSAGVVVTNVLDAVGRVLSSYRYPMGGGTMHTNEMNDYDVLGRVLHRTNVWGGVTSFSYDVPNRQTTASNPDGGTRVEKTYRDGRLEKISGTAVHGESFAYDVQAEGAESVMRETTKSTKLDANGNATSEWTLAVLDDLGRTLRTYYAKASSPYPYAENVYNSLGQLVKSADPDGVTTLYAYDSQGRLNRTAMDLNGNGMIDEADNDDETPDDRITDTIVDVLASGANGNSRGVDIVRTRTFMFTTSDVGTTILVSMVEASTDRRKTWRTAYRDTGGGAPVTTYFLMGLPASGSRTDTMTHPDGSYTESIFSYNRLVTQRERDLDGNQVTSHTYAYDAYGRRWTDTDARNGATTYTYFPSGQYDSVTAPALGTGQPRQATSSFYDNQGRLKGQMLPDGTTVTNFYFTTGLQERTWGSRTYPVGYTYDGQGRMKTMKTWQSFNGGAGTAAVTTWNYDPYRGWLISKDYPNPSTGAAGTAGPNYTYTPGGRLLTRTWDRGTVTTYDYSVQAGSSYTAGDLRVITYSDGTPSTTYGYDRRGRRQTVLRNSITSTFAYNEANQALSESYSGGTLGGLSIVRTYDANLRLSTLDAKAGSTVLQSALYIYDKAGRLDKVKDNAATSYYAAYGYAANSRLVSTLAFTNNASGEGVLTSRVWDKLNRLESVSSQAYLDAAFTGYPLGFTYRYDQANQRRRAELSDGSYWVYEYDSLGQVIKGRRFWSDGSLMAGQHFDYKFDNIGNRDTTSGRASAVSDYTADQLNRYTQRTTPSVIDVLGIANPTANVEVWKDSDSHSVAGRKGEYFHHPLAASNESYPMVHAKSLYGATQTIDAGRQFVPTATETFSYDTDGNLASDGRWTAYAWDGENRLIEMRRDTNSPPEARQKLTFEYDHQSRRIRKTTFTHNSSTWVEQADTIYLYDGWNMLAELNANASNDKLRTYVWGTDLSGSMTGAGGVGGLLWVNNAQASPTGIQFVAFDGNGNVAGLFATADGSNTATYEYGPFGEPLRQTGALAEVNPVRWSTKVADNESGLVFYGYRYYSPSMGMWLSRDPVEERGGRNVYGFCGNAPVRRSDYLGLHGSIEVVFAHALPDSRVGMSFRARWIPPKSWCGPCLPCEQVLWVQTYYYEIFPRVNPPWLLVPEIYSWRKDWDEKDYEENSDSWMPRDCSYPPQKPPETWDDPEVVQIIRSEHVMFRAQTCVKCVRGSEAGKVYGCLIWGYNYRNDAHSQYQPMLDVLPPQLISRPMNSGAPR